MNREPPTVVSLFAGCGGSSLGYKMAGYRELLAVEWNKKAAAVFRRNFPDVCIYEGDVAALADAEALRLAGIESGELDLLDASPPCQGFSTAGKRRIGDDRNDLFREFVRLIGAFNPQAIVMENVSGLIKGKMRLRFAEMTHALRKAGYRVSCRLLNAWWYGVPQSRQRLIWVGLRNDLDLVPSHPEPIRTHPITVAEALGAIGITSCWRGQIKNAMYNNNYFRDTNKPSPSLTSSQRPLIDGVAIEVHPRYRDSKFKEGLAPTVTAGRRPRIKHAPHVIEKWEAQEKRGGNVASFQSRRAIGTRPSPTQISAHRNWSDEEPRYLTVEEAKILQGFPIEFEIYENEYFVIGNSVPPPMAEAIGRHILGLLNKEISNDDPEKV